MRLQFSISGRICVSYTQKSPPYHMLQQKVLSFACLSEIMSFVSGTASNNTATYPSQAQLAEARAAVRVRAAAATRAANAARSATRARAAAEARAAATARATAPPLERVRMYRTAEPDPTSVAAIPALEILQVVPASIDFQFVSPLPILILAFLDLLPNNSH